MRPGTRVRAGDRLAYVDVLGVRQEVVSPVDGIVGATLAEAGDAVEYGQELVRLELAGQAAAGGTSTTDQRTIADAGPSTPAPGSSPTDPSAEPAGSPDTTTGPEGDA
jgi:pyruvate/2-oxoglutarate dehydrogenase complex dihydrolipoamide acyltransferase (E2) component